MTTLSPVRTVSFRIAEDKVAALDAIAKTMDRDRSYLLNEAVENYLYEQEQFTTWSNRDATTCARAGF